MATLVPVVLPWLFGDSFKGAVVPALILVAAGALSYPMQWAIGANAPSLTLLRGVPSYMCRRSLPLDSQLPLARD